MLKKTVKYLDFDDQPQEETLYFNITMTEFTDHMDLAERVEKLDAIMKEERREMTTAEVKSVLDLVKELVYLSYGVRSADGKRFSKKDENGVPRWHEFVETAVYDTFVYSLFVNPQEAVDFVIGVLPADLRAEARKSVEAQLAPKAVEDAPVEKDNRPAWVRENREPTQQELIGMPADQLREMYVAKAARNSQ